MVKGFKNSKRFRLLRSSSEKMILIIENVLP